MSKSAAVAQRNDTIRVLVADHGVVGEGLGAILDAEADMEVGGIADPTDDLVELAERIHPDVVLLNPEITATRGPDVCARLVSLHPAIRILLVSTNAEITLVWEWIAAGAHGYVIKDIDRHGLTQAVRDVHRNEIAVSSVFAGQVIDQMRPLVRLRTEAADWTSWTPPLAAHTTDEWRRAGVAPSPARLTAREREILGRLMDGERVPSIAAGLRVSQSTVRNDLSSIFKKFGVDSQVELIRRLRPRWRSQNDE